MTSDVVEADIHPIYADYAFPYYHNVDVETESEIFSLNEEMEVLAADIATKGASSERVRHLVNYIFDSEHIDINYQSTANLTAIETFNSQNANCMSLTVLSFALAEAAELPALFQRVDVPEYWIRNGDYNMLSGHVNLVVFEKDNPLEQVIYGRNKYTIDFDPSVRKKSFPSTFVDKNTVVAMYYTNKGADALVAGHMNRAYAYLKAATIIAPNYDSAWGNLGVLYRQNELYEKAKRSYQNAIDINENNLTAMDNLALLYGIQGEEEQAQALKDFVHTRRLSNPYYHALLADEAFVDGDYMASVRHYKRAIRIDNKQHEFYFGIAKAYAQMGNALQVRRSLEKAKDHAKFDDEERKYRAKIDVLTTANIRY